MTNVHEQAVEIVKNFLEASMAPTLIAPPR
jgi:hypothetical protein